jgi:hypothetical protein
VYSEGQVDIEHSLAQALLSDIPGPAIEPELYPDATNTGVIHDDATRLTQKVGRGGYTDLISTPQNLDLNQMFQPLMNNPKNKQLVLFKHETVITQSVSPPIKKPYIAASHVQEQQQQQQQHQHQSELMGQQAIKRTSR